MNYLVSSEFGAAMIFDTNYQALDQTSQLKGMILYKTVLLQSQPWGPQATLTSDQLTTDAEFHTNPSALMIFLNNS